MISRQVGAIAGIGACGVGAVLLLTGCASGRYLHLTPDETKLPLCEAGRSIDVTTIGASTTRCRVVDATLVYPDGTEVVVKGEGTGGLESGDRRFAWFDVGDYGLVAAQYRGDCNDYTEWGGEKARQKLADAFGAREGSWACG